MDKILGFLTAYQRLIVVLVLFVAYVMFHIGSADGMIPGVPGYAREDDVYQIRLSLANENFAKAQRQLCEMVALNNRQAAGYASDRLKEFNDELIELTGRVPRLPGCEELGVDMSNVGNR